MGNTVIPGPREKRAAARLQDTVIVTAHLNADAFDAEGRERERGEERSVRLPVRLLSSHRVYSPG